MVGEILNGHVPSEICTVNRTEAPGGYEEIGVLTDPMGRAFYHYGREKVMESLSGGLISLPNLGEFGRRIQSAQRAREDGNLLMRFAWECILRELPAMRGIFDQGVICSGFRVFAKKDGLFGQFGGDVKNPHPNFLDEVTAALKGDSGTAAEASFDVDSPLEEGEAEMATIDDPALRALWNVSSQIRDDAKAEIPFMNDKTGMNAFVASHSIGYVRKVLVAMERARTRSDLAADLFWAGVVEKMLDGEQTSSLGLRAGWMLTSFPPQEVMVGVG